ncbi:NmrA family NAD(P)-binding protein [Salininema proteolyticum]|uniref:NmrA family NAD(P)-binding protein n=1 Tax=Salininema proteolyticum TaxID=1607685 RepID=A0ABV8TVC2_9ACTN
MTRENKTILVAGATGTQGRPTVAWLLRDGWSVRALVRDRTTAAAQELAGKGAELAVGDFDEERTLAAALRRAHGLFAIPPVDYGETGWDTDREYGRGKRIVDLAADSGVRHIVFSTIATTTGPGLPGSSGKRRIEEALGGSGVTFTVLRPVRFMENYLLSGTPVDGLRKGVHRHLFHPDGRMQIIAVEDVAVFAGMAFAEPETYGGMLLELAGDEPTPVEAAARISNAIDGSVRYERVSKSEAEALGPEIARVWNLWEEGHSWRADIPRLRELHPGLKTLDDWLESGGSADIARLEGQRGPVPGRR